MQNNTNNNFKMLKKKMISYIDLLPFYSRFLSAQKQPDRLTLDSEIIAYCILDNEFVNLQTSEGNTFSNIKNTELILNTGFYQFADKTYHLTQPGNYYFSKPFDKNEQRVLLGDNVLDNCAILSNLVIRGNGDDKKEMLALNSIALNRFLSLTCGYSCAFVKEKLFDYKVIAREVNTLTREKENGYNDGHTMLEVFDPKLKKYVLFDVDKKCYFENEKNEKLDLFSFCVLLNKNQPIKIVSKSNFPKLDWLNFVDEHSNFHFQFIEQQFNFDMQQRLKMYKRICSIPVFNEGDKFYACSFNQPIQNTWNTRLTLLSEEEFYAKHYSNK